MNLTSIPTKKLREILELRERLEEIELSLVSGKPATNEATNGAVEVRTRRKYTRRNKAVVVTTEPQIKRFKFSPQHRANIAKAQRARWAATNKQV